MKNLLRHLEEKIEKYLCDTALSTDFLEDKEHWGIWVAQLVKRPPSARVTIPGSRDRAPCKDPCLSGSPPLPLPLTLLLLLLMLLLPVSLSNK